MFYTYLNRCFQHNTQWSRGHCLCTKPWHTLVLKHIRVSEKEILNVIHSTNYCYIKKCIKKAEVEVFKSAFSMHAVTMLHAVISNTFISLWHNTECCYAKFWHSNKWCYISMPSCTYNGIQISELSYPFSANCCWPYDATVVSRSLSIQMYEQISEC